MTDAERAREIAEGNWSLEQDITAALTTARTEGYAAGAQETERAIVAWLRKEFLTGTASQVERGDYKDTTNERKSP